MFKMAASSPLFTLQWTDLGGDERHAYSAVIYTKVMVGCITGHRSFVSISGTCPEL